MSKKFCYEYPRPSVTVDLVIFTIAPCMKGADPELQVLLIRRGGEPHKGRLALPGGFVNMDEDLVDAAARELKEETNFVAGGTLVQLGAYGHPDRDPRTRVITVAFMALCPSEFGDVAAGSDAADAKWYSVGDLMSYRNVRSDPLLAFDHIHILHDAVDRLRKDFSEHGPMYLARSGKHKFTLRELQRIYEAVFFKSMDVRNFRRSMMPFLRPVSGARLKGAGRPAQLFEVKHG
jgi:8-oxo-dGTP diphosphatase